MKYEELLSLIRLTDQSVHAAYCAGSQVYGTASYKSDNDFVIILSDRKAKQDLIFKNQVDVVVYGIDSFNESLLKHNLFALECLFLPKQFRLKDAVPEFSFKFNREKLISSVTEKSESDFLKAKNHFENDSKASKKKLFHSIRLLTFAIQILRSGNIYDYAQANCYWAEIQNNNELDWQIYFELYNPIRNGLITDLHKMRVKRK